jgi:hypothetical protein
MAARFSRREVLRLAGGVALTVGSTKLVVSLAGCGGDDAAPDAAPDAHVVTVLDCEGYHYYLGAYDGAVDTYYTYYLAFYCPDDPGDPWLCYEKPISAYYDQFCYDPTYYYHYPFEDGGGN